MDETQTAQRSMLAGKLVSELQAIAEQVGVKDAKKRKKADLIDAILGTVHGSNGSANGAGSGWSGDGEQARQESVPSGTTPWVPRGGAAELPGPGSGASNGAVAQAEPVSPPAAAAEPAQPAPAGEQATTAPAQEATPAPAGEQATPAPAPAGEQGGSASAPEQAQAAQGTAPGGGQPSVQGGNQGSGSGGDGYVRTDTRPEYRRDTQREGDGTRERGRRRRRRDRNGERPERPGDRMTDRIDRQERFDRPRREPEIEDQSELEVRSGILDMLPEGYGFLRTSGYLPGQEDVYVSLSQVRRSQLRRGDEIVGAVRRPKEGEKYPALVRIDQVDGMAPEEIIGRKWFEKLTPLYPEERLHMELPDNPGQIAQRIIDLVAPIGKGQRGMIVSPPKAGKTTIMKQIANSITGNNPECHLIVLLVDERPEEVTDMQRSVKGEIVYSTFDRPSEDHIQATELTLDRAKRLVELGKDVVILLDGITRLSRAYNLATPASGRILSGGVDSTALYPPKRFFGAARNIEQGGSLTIIATALVETGSRMDEVIFEEFKGTGNWELRLDRRASEKRIFPAIDIQASGTRKEELLLSSEELALVWKLRRVLHALEGVAGLELLVDKMRQTKGNMQFLREIQKVPIGD
ncbi:MAG TPA: transcription termination factor Rho [Actinomycetota bacterium]|nr:transcription termination factor Rho [Actinomycetota bacterium]